MSNQEPNGRFDGPSESSGEPRGDSGYGGNHPPPGGRGYAAGPPPGSMPQYAPQPVTVSDEKTWAILTHVGALFLSFLAPLIVYLIYKDRSAFLRWHAAQQLNFQIGVVIAMFVGTILSFVLVGAPILLAVAILDIVFCILAAVAASKYEYYKIPLAVPMVN